MPNFQHIKRIAYKELNLFFASPVAYLFLGVFVSVTLFIFFWGESFFSRNIADVRPVFEWMPILLIVLSSAITMRMWSEEKRSGTLEHVLTLPLNPWHFVLGKFAACKTLLAIALLITLPLPITVSVLGNLDWGPVISAYVAALFLGSAYIAIGLFVSSRTDNQIVSLIVTVIVCALFYLLGSNLITNLVNNQTAELLRALGTGARFESITRGVLDFRDLYYYVSVTLVFLIFNRLYLEKTRWAGNQTSAKHRQWHWVSGLAMANVIAVNLWLSPVAALRIDLTEGKLYSISDTTKNYLSQLREPLKIRGFFSEKTHPLLSPLVPQLHDLLDEYAVAGKGQVRVEIIDPALNPEAEEEAGSKFGIRPTPFRVADRYQAAVVNSYFNLVIEYGDEYRVLGFQDLIETRSSGIEDLDVKLKNPEYDITNAIKQVLQSYQSAGNLFDTISQPLKFTTYISDVSRLPKSLADYAQVLRDTLSETVTESRGKLTFEFIDPNANGGATAQQIAKDYGFQPMASSLFDTNTFYFYMVLSDGETLVQIPLPDDLQKSGLERGLDAGLKRFAQGFNKTIGLVVPEANPYAAQMGQSAGPSFNTLNQVLNENFTSKNEDLSDGVIDDDIDLLAILSPNNLDEKALFAIDQYLMRGGTVVLASSPFNASFSRQGLSASAQDSGLTAWLGHHGLSIENTFVLDRQNAAFPIPVTRKVGMFQVQEMNMVDYPWFVELREKGINQKNPATSPLMQLTLPWASPITVDDAKQNGRQVLTLLTSSPSSWTDDNTHITPSSAQNSHSNFTGPHTLALASSGRFQSYFKGKPSPLLQKDVDTPAPEGEDANEDEQENEIISGIIEQSSEAARLVVIGSNSFAEDQVTSILSSVNGNNYAAPFELLTNIFEWSLEDEGMLSIRSHSHFNRTLPPLEASQKQFWEYINYLIVLLLLAAIALIRFMMVKMKIQHYQLILKGENA